MKNLSFLRLGREYCQFSRTGKYNGTAVKNASVITGSFNTALGFITHKINETGSFPALTNFMQQPFKISETKWRKFREKSKYPSIVWDIS